MDRIAQDGVYCPATLPMNWRAEPAPTADDIAGWMYGNVTLLRALATIEAVQPDKENGSPGSGAEKAIERLEFKIDLALNLIARLLAQNIALPPACPALIGAAGIEWIDEGNPPAPGDDILMSIYISPKLPQPLMLPAKVASVLRENDGTRIYATFNHLNDEAQDWLLRTVFRYHRRAIQNLHQA